MTRLTDDLLARLRTLSPRARAAILALLGLGGVGTGVVVVDRTRPDTPPPAVVEPPDQDGPRLPPVDPPAAGDVLARLRIKPPAAGLHLVRVNVPMPASAPSAVHLLDRNGRALPTQTDVVTRGPKGEARMVEVMALASTGTGAQEFALVPGASPAGPAAPADVDLRLRAVDHAGTTFGSVDVSSSLTRTGPVAVTEERRGYLRSSAGEALLGFILAETQVAGEDFTLCELVVHNGAVPVQGDAYFKDLRLEIPPGHVVSHLLPQPWADPNGTLIRANPNGTMHAMLQKQSVEFRFVVHRPGDADALAALRMDGFGVCVPGPGLWSPQNPETPWYFPQAMPMPTATAGMAFDTYPYGKSLGAISNALNIGAPLPTNGGGNSGAAGPYHPWGSSYGGATGGDGIWQFDGLGVLLTGRVDKLHEVMAYHRATTDRHRTGIFDAKGGVQRAEALAPGWKVAATPGQMWKGKEGPLSWGTAGQWRRDQVSAAGKLPAYDGYLRSFQAIDFQHLVRRTSASCALVWLCNDSVGRWTLELEAEWARMWAYETGQGGLADAVTKAQQYPGKGAFGGRAEGWARFVIAAQFQVSGDPRLLGWMKTDLGMLERAQLPSGCWMALEHGKPADGFPNDAVAQAIENGICVGGVQACYGATGDARYLPLLRRAGDGHRGVHWRFGSGAPYTRRAVRPKDITKPAYTAATAPAPLFTETDNWQSFSLLASALAAGSTDAEACVKDALGLDPLAGMLAKPMFQLDNRAPLLALYQIKGAK